jgi:hypothetical protein
MEEGQAPQRRVSIRWNWDYGFMDAREDVDGRKGSAAHRSAIS